MAMRTSSKKTIVKGNSEDQPEASSRTYSPSSRLAITISPEGADESEVSGYGPMVTETRTADMIPQQNLLP